jgi:hypothetical protein
VDKVGLGGSFIRTKVPPAVGTFIQVLIDIPGGGVQARAIVRNIKPDDGMGVGIISMSQDDRQGAEQLPESVAVLNGRHCP